MTVIGLGCDDEVVDRVAVGHGGGTTTTTSDTGGGPPAADCAAAAERVDLLLSIDNSRSMADKQQILALTVPDLVGGLVNPPCVDDNGVPSGVQPTGPSEACPDPAAHRAFAPVVDLHVGVVSSSLGDHGGDVCPADMPQQNNDDMAQLLTRDASGATVASYQDLGFLAWDPTQGLVPPGEADLTTFLDRLVDIVAGVGEVGCGFESQLESWYRFLIDPNPPTSVEEVNGVAVLSGTDDALLAQRRAFLRPDSLLVILMLTDENDCSIRDGGQFFYSAKSQSGAGMYHLPRAQVTCQTDPADDCCRSCGQSDEGCPPKGEECATAHDTMSDPINLRCWDQKRRFGIDFLNPIERYADALGSEVVADREGAVVPNPLYSDLDPSDEITEIRGPGRVFVAGIVGVPWQLVARRDGSGNPDLALGLDANGNALGGFQSATELAANGTWDQILGDFATYGQPSDPHMVESVVPRTGLPAPTAGYLADPIAGHEKTSADGADLQYSCIFPLPTPRDCSASPPPNACDCQDLSNDNPLCESPDGANGQIQYFAKAYPSLRQLDLIERLGSQGILASICPAQLDDETDQAWGYRPAAQSIIEALTSCLD